MALLTLSPAYAAVSGKINWELTQEIENLLRYREPGYQHSWKFKNRHLTNYDGWANLYRYKEGVYYFPPGLAHRLPSLRSIPFQDLHAPAPAARPERKLPNGTTLYDDQWRALQMVVEGRRGLLSLAVNFGKTETIAGILKAYSGSPAVVIVPAPLVEQTASRLSELLYEEVVWRKPGYERSPHRILVASIHSIRANWGRIKNRIKTARLLIVDEVHTVTLTWFPILAHCEAPIRIGLSGSVEDARVPMIEEAYFGPVLMRVGDATLVEQGRSARPDIYMVKTGCMVPERVPYQTAYEMGVIHNGERNALLADLASRAAQGGSAVLLLYYRLDHGRVLAEMLKANGIRVREVRGEEPFSTIVLREQVASGDVQVVVGSTVMNQGVNIPEFNTLINAAGWKSPMATGQKLGRVLRLKPRGLNSALVIDTYDLGFRIFTNHSKARLRLYKEKGFSPIQCVPHEIVNMLNKRGISDGLFKNNS